ncbi:MAG TPA: hypothetical protein VJV78_08145 [Polyangiales bacterium]|nr:hypothetical protein [Polyangiales bacterium]
MRTVYLALVGCAALAGACKLDGKAFEHNAPEGVSSKDKQDNGGVDLVPRDRSARAMPQAGSVAPAVDSGMEIPPETAPPDAAEPPDSAAATEVQDAGPSPASTQPQDAAADSGNSPTPEDDAGTAEPEPDPEPAPTCTTHDCYCETYCKRATALACPEEPVLADCIPICQLMVKPGCEAQALAAVRCKVESPAAKYECDTELLTVNVLGCELEDQALYTCRSR